MPKNDETIPPYIEMTEEERTAKLHSIAKKVNKEVVGLFGTNFSFCLIATDTDTEKARNGFVSNLHPNIASKVLIGVADAIKNKGYLIEETVIPDSDKH